MVPLDADNAADPGGPGVAAIERLRDVCHEGGGSVVVARRDLVIALGVLDHAVARSVEFASKAIRHEAEAIAEAAAASEATELYGCLLDAIVDAGCLDAVQQAM